MPASNVWRITAVNTQGADLVLSRLRLLTGGIRVDAGAVISCSHTPKAGELWQLMDDSAATCTFAAGDVRQPGFQLTFTLPDPLEVDGLELGLVMSYLSPVALRLEYRESSQFVVLADYIGIEPAEVPGVHAIGLMLKGSPESGYIVAAIGGTSDASKVYTNTTNSTWGEKFSQTIDIGLFAAAVTNPGDTGVLATKTLNQFSIYDTWKIHCLNGSWSSDQADLDVEFLRADGSVVAALRSTYRSIYALRMQYGSSLQALTEAGTLGSYPEINGTLTFAASSMAWTPATSNNNHTSWTFAAPFNEVTAVRFSRVRAYSSYSGSAAAFATVLRTPTLIQSGFTGVLPKRATQLLKSTAAVKTQVSPHGLHNMLVFKASKLLDAESGGAGCIHGTVELYAQAGNIPLPRRVRLHRSRGGLLVRETWSDAQGNYRFDGISERYTYDVIAWDHEGLQQSVVANDLTPEVMP